MTNNLICLNRRLHQANDRGWVEQCHLRDYLETSSAKWLEEKIKKIASTDNEEEQRKLKGDLPFRCPHYAEFRDNHRDREHIVSESFTWQTCVDIDDAEQVEPAKKKALELNAEEGGMWKDMVLHMDYSARKKLHIDIRLPLGMTVPEAQRAFCKALGVEPDTSCFTPERFIYITPTDFEIYTSEHWYETLSAEEMEKRRKAYLARGLRIDGRTDEGKYYDPEKNSSRAACTTSTECQEDDYVRHFPETFKNVKLLDIIAAYWSKMGAEPVEGERNDKLHQLAWHLRAICDDNEAWLMQVMPRYGLSEQEMRSIVHSACQEPTKGSKVMKEIVAQLSAQQDQADRQPQESSCNHMGLSDSMVRSLPIGLKESLKGVPKNMQMPVLCSLMPLAGAYADFVEAEYCDGNLHHMGLMSIIVGEQASGKSVCKRVVDIWTRQMEQQDAESRVQEEEYKRECKRRKANEKAPEEPKVVVRKVPITISNGEILKRLKNSQGHTLYSFDEEIDTVVKTNKSGKWAEKWDIYRKSFDRSEWGQDYLSDNTESGIVQVNYNWTALGTYGSFGRMFKGDNVENGLSSRMLIAKMPQEQFSEIPKFKRLPKADEDRIQQAVRTLSQASGLVETSRLRKAINAWLEEKRKEASKNDDYVKDTFRKRAGVIGFRCGVIYHLLSGCKRESKACLEFATMMAEYCLTQQMNFFGDELQKAHKEAMKKVIPTPNQIIYDRLPDTFTIEDLMRLKGNGFNNNAARQVLFRWKKDDLADKVDQTHWKKKSNVTGVTPLHGNF